MAGEVDFGVPGQDPPHGGVMRVMDSKVLGWNPPRGRADGLWVSRASWWPAVTEDMWDGHHKGKESGSRSQSGVSPRDLWCWLGGHVSLDEKQMGR